MENSRYLQRNLIRQYISTFTGTIIILSTGMNSGWPSPSIMKLLRKDSEVQISSSEGGWISVANLMGAPFGVIAGALIVDRIGRKPTLLISSPLAFIAWLTVAYATSALVLWSARFMIGIANGLACTVLPMYIGEIANKNIRGLLGMSFIVAFNFGILAINIIGIYFTIKTTALISSLVPVLHFITFLWAPESPYFFVLKEKEQSAAHSFRKLNGTKNVDSEISQLAKTVALDSKCSGVFLDIFTDRHNRKALGIQIGLTLFQHTSGYMSLVFYCLSIFKEANGATTEGCATIIYFSVQLVASTVSSFLVDRLGRRPLLIISASVSSVALATECIYFYLKDRTSVDMTNFGILPLTALVICAVSYNVGLSVIPIVLIGELFPIKIKAFAVCTVNIFYYSFGTIVAKLFQIIKDEYGLYAPFFIFAICDIVGLIFIIYFVPETKGKTLEQIQATLKSKKSIKSNAANTEVNETLFLNKEPLPN